MSRMAVDPRPAKAAEVIAHAVIALDGQANAMRWLKRPNRNLTNRTPLDVLFQGSPDDMQEVDELLFALENGIYT